MEHVLKLDPNYTPALAKIAEIYVDENNLEKAIGRIQMHIDAYPGKLENLVLLGDLLYKKGDIIGAEQIFTELQQLHPGEPRSYFVLASIQLENNKLKRALDEYIKLIKINPQSVSALMGYAVLMEKSGNNAEASKGYKKILSIDENFAPAANNLSWLLMHDSNADLGEALRLAKLAKKAQPNSPAINDTLGYAYYLQGLYGLATMQFRDAVSLLPQDPLLRYHLALSLKAQRADGEALSELRKSLAMNTYFPQRFEAQKLYEKWVK